METKPNFKLSINFNDSNVTADERDAQALRFMAELREMDEVETVSRVLDPNPPEGNKTLGGFLVGLLSAEVSLENSKRLLRFIGDRLGGKPIELEVEANGRRLKVKASSREELEAAIQAAQDFIG